MTIVSFERNALAPRHMRGRLGNQLFFQLRHRKAGWSAHASHIPSVSRGGCRDPPWGSVSRSCTLSWDFRERSPAERCVERRFEGRVRGVGGFLGRALEKIWNLELDKTGHVTRVERNDELAAAEREGEPGRMAGQWVHLRGVALCCLY